MTPATSAAQSRQVISTIYNQYVKPSAFGFSPIVFFVTLIIVFPLQKIILPHIATSCVQGLGRASSESARRLIGLFVIAIAIIMGTRTLMYFTGLDMQNTVNVNTRRIMIRRLLALQRNSTQNPRVGNWITQLENVASIVQLVFCKFINTIAPEIASFITIGAFFTLVDGRIGAAYALMLISYAVFFACCIRYSQEAAVRDYEQRIHINDHLQNILYNMPYIRAAQSLEFEKKILENKNDRLSKLKNNFLHTNTRFLAVPDVFTLAFTLVAVYILYQRITRERDNTDRSPWLMTSFIVIIIFIKDYDDFKKTLTEIFNFSYTTSLFEEMVMHNRRQDRAKQKHVPTTPPSRRRYDSAQSPDNAIAVHNLVLTNGVEPLPLTINARFRANQLHGIEGRSGIGKSVLAHTLTGIAQPHDGSIWIHGKDVSNNMAERRRRTTYMPQTAQLFNGTIYDNIVYAHKKHWNHSRVHAIVQRSGLIAVLRGKNPRDGHSMAYLSKKVQNEGSNLSGGQRQTVMFLRTLVMSETEHARDRIYVLDEPHAALDPDSEATFMRNLRKLSAHSTVILITHSKRAMRYCDTHLRLETTAGAERAPSRVKQS